MTTAINFERFATVLAIRDARATFENGEDERSPSDVEEILEAYISAMNLAALTDAFVAPVEGDLRGKVLAAGLDAYTEQYEREWETLSDAADDDEA